MSPYFQVFFTTRVLYFTSFTIQTYVFVEITMMFMMPCSCMFSLTTVSSFVL
eukprot:UN08804